MKLLFVKFAGPFLLLAVLASVNYQYKTGELFSDFAGLMSNVDVLVDNLASNSWSLLLFTIASLVFTVASNVVVIHVVKSYINNKGKIIENDISEGLKKDFFSVLGLAILVSISTLVGLILCLLPGIYLGVVFFIVYPILVLEEIPVSDAFSKCFKLIKDNWWISFAMILVFSILIAILGYVFQLPTTIYTFVEAFTIASKDISSDQSEVVTNLYGNWVFLLLSAIALLGQYVLTIFTIIMSTLLYFNLSEKHDFTGTYEQIDNIGN